MEVNIEENVKNNKSKKIIIMILIICMLLVITGVIVIKNVVGIRSNEENNYEDSNVVEGTTLFEDIGHYGAAIAGNNNSDRGTGIGQNVRLINSYPENWEEIKKNIPLDILSRINNMSGSRLDFNGTIKKLY